MTIAADPVRADVCLDPAGRGPTRMALLGVGQVGGALAALASEAPLAHEFTVVSGLVRDASRPRPQASHVPLTADPHLALAHSPEVVVEALGGLEPARTLVLRALRRGIPVVTANKSLLAACGDELLAAAAEHGTGLRYEAAVLAGVPFLGTFAARPLAREITGCTGIVNGTTNFILSRMAEEAAPFAGALAEAQRLGYAEPDPGSDVEGVDAAEKLCVLLRHFGAWSVRPADVHAEGIAAITPGDIRTAAAFGGVLKPVVSADWAGGNPAGFAGPAFVPADHPLARVTGVQNAIVLRNRIAGDLIFAGPGAGPRVTAATLLDDAVEITRGVTRANARRTATRTAPLGHVASPWFVRISGNDVPPERQIADVLARHDLGVRRASEPAAGGTRWFITHACAPDRLASALRALSATTGCATFRMRVLTGSERTPEPRTP